MLDQFFSKFIQNFRITGYKEFIWVIRDDVKKIPACIDNRHRIDAGFKLCVLVCFDSG